VFCCSFIAAFSSFQRSKSAPLTTLFDLAGTGLSAHPVHDRQVPTSTSPPNEVHGFCALVSDTVALCAALVYDAEAHGGQLGFLGKRKRSHRR